MSRENKYRAWDKVKKEFIDFNKIGFLEDGSMWYLQGLDEYENETDPPYFEDDDTWVLLQFTGLKDKNGVEIYEGDVIASQNKDRDNWYVSHHEVVWHDTGFMGKQICSGSYIGLDYWTRGENGYVVIGNIYENPDLLEETK